MNSAKIIKFWFEDHGPADWYKKDAAFDQLIRNQFSDTYEDLIERDLPAELDSEQEALAAIIVLDQFSRNMFRNTPKAFATDETARAIADMMVEKGWDQKLPPEKRHFVYLPYMHSENLQDQEKMMQFSKAMAEDGEPSSWAVEHHRLIEKYGRFPHRNDILGRPSTQAEKEYLKQPDAGF